MEDVAKFKCRIKEYEKEKIKNKRYNNKHQIIKSMLSNIIIIFFIYHL